MAPCSRYPPLEPNVIYIHLALFQIPTAGSQRHIHPSCLVPDTHRRIPTSYTSILPCSRYPQLDPNVVYIHLALFQIPTTGSQRRIHPSRLVPDTHRWIPTSYIHPPRLLPDTHRWIPKSYTSILPCSRYPPLDPNVIYIHLALFQIPTTGTQRYIHPSRLVPDTHHWIPTSYTSILPCSRYPPLDPNVIYIHLALFQIPTTGTQRYIHPSRLVPDTHRWIPTSYTSTSPCSRYPPLDPNVIYIHLALFQIPTTGTQRHIHPPRLVPDTHHWNPTSYTSTSPCSRYPPLEPNVIYIHLALFQIPTAGSQRYIHPSRLVPDTHRWIPTSYTSISPCSRYPPLDPNVVYIHLALFQIPTAESQRHIHPSCLVPDTHHWIPTLYTSISPCSRYPPLEPNVIYIHLALFQIPTTGTQRYIHPPRLVPDTHRWIPTSYTSISPCSRYPPLDPNVIYIHLALFQIPTAGTQRHIHPSCLVPDTHRWIPTSYTSILPCSRYPPLDPNVIYIHLALFQIPTAGSQRHIHPSCLVPDTHRWIPTSYTSILPCSRYPPLDPNVIYIHLALFQIPTAGSQRHIHPSRLVPDTHLWILTSYTSTSPCSRYPPLDPNVIYIHLALFQIPTAGSQRYIHPSRLVPDTHRWIPTSYTSISPCSRYPPLDPNVVYIHLALFQIPTAESQRHIHPSCLVPDTHHWIPTLYTSISPCSRYPPLEPNVIYIHLALFQIPTTGTQRYIHPPRLVPDTHRWIPTSYTSISPCSRYPPLDPNVIYIHLALFQIPTAGTQRHIHPSCLVPDTHRWIPTSYTSILPCSRYPPLDPNVIYIHLALFQIPTAGSQRHIHPSCLVPDTHRWIPTSYTSILPCSRYPPLDPNVIYIHLALFQIPTAGSQRHIHPSRLVPDTHLWILTSYTSISLCSCSAVSV